MAVDAACQRGIRAATGTAVACGPAPDAGAARGAAGAGRPAALRSGATAARPRRGRGGGRREASAVRAPEPQAQEGPAGGATSLAKRGAQEQPGVPPTPEGTSAAGCTPVPAARVRRGTRARNGRRRRLGGAERCPRRRRGARLAAAYHPACVPSHRRLRPTRPLRQRSRRCRSLGRTPQYRRRRQTSACPPRWQWRISGRDAPSPAKRARVAQSPVIYPCNGGGWYVKRDVRHFL